MKKLVFHLHNFLPTEFDRVRTCDNVLLDFSIPELLITAQPKKCMYGYSLEMAIGEYWLGDNAYKERRQGGHFDT